MEKTASNGVLIQDRKSLDVEEEVMNNTWARSSQLCAEHCQAEKHGTRGS
jgi:hypothetical protein